jgi:SpoVK/Ycf46/Vps4 family AAA+-type ATPase
MAQSSGASLGTIIAPIITTLASTYLSNGEQSPIITMIAFQSGNLISGYVDKIIDPIKKYTYDKIRPSNEKNALIINKTNPIYSKIETWIFNKFMDGINHCEISAKKGDITFELNKLLIEKELKIDYCDHKLYIIIKELSKNTDTINSIYITSPTANIQILREFIKTICDNINKLEIHKLEIYRTDAVQHDGKNKNKECRWDEISVHTNRNLSNTIMSDEINKELIDDVKEFLNNEKWYTLKGIPYKKGYLLHGPPGTGKTSIIKAIANEYKLQIFCVDLTIVDDNNKLTKLISDINYYTNGKKHILVFEDIDRTDFIKQMGSKYYGNKINITTDCFLNILDGIIESYGRLLFITANDISDIKTSAALIRPGRIDKTIELGFCDKTQLINMMKHFYCDLFTEEHLTKLKNIAPTELTSAHLIKLMQIYSTDPTKLIENLNKLIDNDKVNSSDKPTIKTTRVDWYLKNRQNRIRKEKSYIRKVQKDMLNIQKRKDKINKWILQSERHKTKKALQKKKLAQQSKGKPKKQVRKQVKK